MAKAAPTALRLEGEKGSGPARSAGGTPRHFRRTLAITFISYLVIVAILASGNFMRPFDTDVGATLHMDAVAPFDFFVVDPVAMEERRASIEREGALIWLIDHERESQARQKLNALFDLIQLSNPQNTDQLNDLIQQVPAQTGIAIDATIAGNFLPSRLQSLSPPMTLEFLKTQLMLAIEDVLSEHHVISNRILYEGNLASGRLMLLDLATEEREETINPENVLVWRDEVENFLRFQSLPRYFANENYRALREAALAVLTQLIGGPDIYYSETGTEEYATQQLSRLQANPPMKEYKTGDLIAKADDRLDPLQAVALETINAKRRELILIRILGIMLISAFVFAAVALYVMRFRGGARIDEAAVALHALPVIIGLLIGQTAFFFLTDRAMVKFFFPAAMVALLSSLVVNPRTGFVMVLVGSILFGIVNSLGLDFLALALFGGFTTVLTSRRLRERADLIQVAWKVGFVNVAIVVIFSFIGGSWRPNLVHMAAAFFNGIVSVGASLFIMRYFERFFGIVTDLRLLELTGLRHPLIMQLEEKAPGSYQHVLNVTKLAEAAANAIGANYLLVRAGALFHDIGKMVKPKYFSENQVTIEDKRAHSRLSPYMSVLIIKNHVKEGVELAREADLPQAIIDFIPQHHGTGLIRFFYAAALKRYEESATANPVREEDFRYPGPRPQTIETAIVLLADSVEAIAASKFTGGQVNEDEIRRVTQMAISERFNDGQFDECDLTMRHLRDMREAFVRTLMARYHFRVAYPTLPKSPAAKPEITSTSIAISGPSLRAENPN